MLVDLVSPQFAPCGGHLGNVPDLAAYARAPSYSARGPVWVAYRLNCKGLALVRAVGADQSEIPLCFALSGEANPVTNRRRSSCELSEPSHSSCRSTQC